ncbi:MAG: GAF domain-containing sensor histidine kinase [Gaiellales bacterium]
MHRLLDLGRSLVAELDLETLLRSILDAARELTDARYAALGVLDHAKAELERFETLGFDDATYDAIGALPRGHGVLGVLISDPRPLRLADVSAHPQSYGFPLGHPPMRSFLGVPIVIRGEPWGNIYVTDAQRHASFDLVDEQTLAVLANWAATAIDNARLHTSEARRRAELEQSLRALETTIEIARAVAGETRLEPILELIAKRGRALVEARGILILLVDGDDLVVTNGAGALASGLVGERVPIEGSATGLALTSRRPQRLADVPQDMHFGLAERLEARAGLLVPMTFHGRSVGVLVAVDRQVGGPEFSREDELVMQAFAASAATALATAQDVAAEGLRRSIEASELERTHWARELHDETLQSLAATRLTLATALRESEPSRLAEATTDAIAQIDASIADLRNLIADLRPAALDALGAGAAIETLIAHLRARTDVEIELESLDLAYESGRDALRQTPAIESTLYRITQEALSNVAKHSQARRAVVSVVQAGNTITLRVRDDGIGFEPNARSTGFGLIGMRERAALVSGRLELESSPGGGTTVEVVIPARPVSPR